MTRLKVLSHSSASVERIFSLVNHVKNKTNSLKLRLLGNVVGITSTVKKPSKRIYMDT